MPEQLALSWDRLEEKSTRHGVQQGHRDAINNPAPGFETAIVGMLRSLAQYADAHRQRYGETIKGDFIGGYWEALGDALIGLLNGEAGRLDCGVIDGWVRALTASEAEAADTKALLNELSPEPDAPTPKPVPRAARATKAKPSAEPAAIGVRALTARQRELVAMVAVVDNVANYTDPGRIPDWKELKSTMLALGGTWRSKKGFIFPDDIDAAELVRLAATTGEILDPKAASFFPTPDWLADELVGRATVSDADSVLEPSAGDGALIKAIRRAAPNARLCAIEALPANIEKLRALGVTANQCDFMSCPNYGLFSRVIMNPPFGGRADIKHVTRAFEMLAPGGVLVAIMSSGVAYRNDRLATDFRELVHGNNGEIIDNPEGAFLESGTGVRTVSVVMTKGLR